MAVRATTTAIGGKFSVFPLTDATAQTRSLALRIARKATPGLAAAGLFLGGTAQAADINVDAGAVAVDNADGVCSLPEAIFNANNDNQTGSMECSAGNGPDTLILPAGSNFTFGALLDLSPTLFEADGYNALPSITSAITIQGNESIIERAGTANLSGYFFRLVHTAASGDLTLEDVTLRNGNTSNNNIYPANVGGGIFNNGGSVTLTNSTVSGNEAPGGGGGLSNIEGSITLTNSSVSGNSGYYYYYGYGNYGVGRGYGGGIFNWAGTVTLTNSSVSGNTTGNKVNTFGGGIFNGGGGTVILTNSSVSGNEAASSGGGIFNSFAGSSGGDITLTNSIVSDNKASVGGGIDNNNHGNVTLIGSTVSGNEADLGGGGFANSQGNVTLNGCTISGNTANSVGGGIWNRSAGSVTLTNSTVSGNTADEDGGGIRNSNGGTVSLTNSTVSGNSAGINGGGIDNYLLAYGGTATAIFRNSLVVNNTGDNCTGSSTFNTEGVNFADDGTCPGFTVDTGAGNLGPPAFNGGATQTLALMAGNPAIDSADTTICNSAPPDGAGSLDQRGVPRPIGSACDVGAFEVGAQFDLGDAPDADPQNPPTQNYPTLLANNGAAHVVSDPLSPGGPILGGLIDTETDGQPTAAADGDDSNNTADEDGVFFTSDIQAGTNANVDVTVTGGAGLLNAWIDFNQDGDWDDEGEQIFADQALVDGSNTGLAFTVPPKAIAGESFARFRLDTTGGLTPRGVATDGEVEDYPVTIIANDSPPPDDGEACNPPNGLLSGPLHALAQALGPLLGSTLRTLAQQFCEQGL